MKADLLDKGAVEAALRQAGAESVTHVFHCAYLMKKAPKEECEVGWEDVLAAPSCPHKGALPRMLCLLARRTLPLLQAMLSATLTPQVNLSMLKNVVEAAEAAGAHLQHVFCMEVGRAQWVYPC